MLENHAPQQPLREDKAIIADIAGATRDVIEINQHQQCTLKLIVLVSVNRWHRRTVSVER